MTLSAPPCLSLWQTCDCEIIAVAAAVADFESVSVIGEDEPIGKIIELTGNRCRRGVIDQGQDHSHWNGDSVIVEEGEGCSVIDPDPICHDLTERSVRAQSDVKETVGSKS